MITPRIMVIDSVATNVQEKSQLLSLILLDRQASAEFPKRFPDFQRENVKAALDYVREHSIDNLSQGGSCLIHKRFHRVKGMNYHLGDIITEKTAYDLGYPHPHIDTVAGRIAEINQTINPRSKLTATLKKEGLITEHQSAVYKVYPDCRLEIVSNERERDFMRGPTIRESNCESHPVTLFIYDQEDKVMPVGVGFLVPEQNLVYEFMAYVPMDKQNRKKD